VSQIGTWSFGHETPTTAMLDALEVLNRAGVYLTTRGRALLTNDQGFSRDIAEATAQALIARGYVARASRHIFRPEASLTPAGRAALIAAGRIGGAPK
jgi:hypothetical protein